MSEEAVLCGQLACAGRHGVSKIARLCGCINSAQSLTNRMKRHADGLPP